MSLTPGCVFSGCLILVNRMTSTFNKSIYRPEPKDHMWSCSHWSRSLLQLERRVFSLPCRVAKFMGFLCLLMSNEEMLSPPPLHTIQSSPLSGFYFLLKLLLSQCKNKLSARLLLPYKYYRKTCYYLSSLALTLAVLSFSSF